VTTVELVGTRPGGRRRRLLPLLPFRFSSWAIARVNQEDARPAVFYFHPWEIDPHQPRGRRGVAENRAFGITAISPAMEGKLLKLLRDHAWTAPMRWSWRSGRGCNERLFAPSGPQGPARRRGRPRPDCGLSRAGLFTARMGALARVEQGCGQRSHYLLAEGAAEPLRHIFAHRNALAAASAPLWISTASGSTAASSP
jgi:hypothetical protein